jgi:hypothetical protein
MKTLNLTDSEKSSLITILRAQEKVTTDYNSAYKISRKLALIPIQSMLMKLGEETSLKVND